MLASLAATPGSLTPSSGIPHRDVRLTVDGDAADWHTSGARFVIARPPAAGEPRAHAEVRLAWDREALWALFEVTDPTFHAPPKEIGGPELFQWDSVEIYVDGLGDSAPRMAADDFQVLLAPDGRYAVLEGDPLLLELEELTVPKRERPAVVIRSAGVATADGYRVECAIPWAVLGIEPREGKRWALDLGLNDWLADHSLARQLAYDLETVRKLDQQPGAPRIFTPNGLEAESAEGLEQRLYRPWSLGGTGDFGHPERWRPVVLAGGPGFADRFVEALGPGWTLAGGALTTVLLVVGLLVFEERRHRRRVGALLERLAVLEQPPEEMGGAAEAAPERGPAPERLARATPTPPDPLEWLEHAADRYSSSPGLDRLERRAVRAIREHLDEALSPGALAGALYVSLRTLQRQLTETLGCSPGELILAVKMREARRLLERGELQVQQVARRVGYDDPGHFSRRFKAYFGHTPAAALLDSGRHREERTSVA